MKKILFLLSCAWSCGLYANNTITHTIYTGDSITYTYSKTIPVLFINTQNNAPIISKDEYTDATAYLETFDLEGYEGLGTADIPLALEIKGRGNSSWNNYDKKPYRLKFKEKQSIMGMTPNKHFALIAHVGGYTQYLTEAAGLELGKWIGLAWTPNMKPLELVMNGEYLGMYFLTEHVRIDKNRVNIVEQDDNATDSTEITGGWLVEIDNYIDPAQIIFTEGNGEKMKITYKSPEILSIAQEIYLRSQFEEMDSLIYSADKTSTLLWDKYINLEYLVRYYIIQEILDNADAFHGSTYLHKDRGDDKKWIFGPLWDMGYSFWRTEKNFLYINPHYASIRWIGEIAKFPLFQEKVREVWRSFYNTKYEEIYAFIDEFAAQCIEADEADAQRWPQYNKGGALSKGSSLKSLLRKNVKWLNEQWNDNSGVKNNSTTTDIKIFVFDDKLIISSPIKAQSVSLCNINGITTHLDRCGDNQYLLPSNSSGYFIIRIITDENKTLHTKYIIN